MRLIKQSTEYPHVWRIVIEDEEIERLKNMLSHFRDLLHEAERLPVAVIKQGKQGNIIGFIERYDVSEYPELGRGMVVLFASPPPEELVGEMVALSDFVVRTSRLNPDKKYVKCFDYVVIDSLERAIEETENALSERRKELLKYAVMKLFGLDPEEFERAIEGLSEFASRMMAVPSYTDRVLFASFLHKLTSYVTLVCAYAVVAIIPHQNKSYTTQNQLIIFYNSDIYVVDGIEQGNAVPHYVCPCNEFESLHPDLPCVAVPISTGELKPEVDESLAQQLSICLWRKGVVNFWIEHWEEEGYYFPPTLVIVLPKDSSLLRDLKAIVESDLSQPLRHTLIIKRLQAFCGEVV